MISAFARGGAVLEEPRYAAAARRAAEFVIGPHVRCALRHSAAPLAPGRGGHPGFLDDYALFAQGLLDLYEAQFDRRIWNSPSALPKNRWSCSKTPRKERSSPPPRTMPAWSCA
jgi:uncharacterized protein YyaL (SSP411 family)